VNTSRSLEGAHAKPATPSQLTIAGNLRQMIAVLERERQALAALNPDDLIETVREKELLCEALSPFSPEALDAETLRLADTARKLNEVNRRVRNLIAANVAARIAALGGERATYSPPRTLPMS